jgi:hypothetical protein
MKPQEIEKIQQLDVQGINGTVQSILLDPNINQASYPEVLYYLLVKHIEEKSYFERTTNNMMAVLRANNLHEEMNRCLELKE